MTQLSRPYQIALVVLGLFAAVWFLALRGHSASTGGGGSSPSSSASSSPSHSSSASPSSTSPSSASAPAAKPATPATPYHGSAPGVAGLTRAIEKAHGAVTQSEQNARRLQEKSAQASGDSSRGPAASIPSSTPKTGAEAAHTATPKSAATAPKGTSIASSATGARSGSQPKAGAARSMQAPVERALERGELVTVLFWNPKGIVDRLVHSELQSVGHASGGNVAVFVAGAKQVGSFGSFTKAVQVNETPTILIVNPRGQATTLVGLTDVFSIDQAIGEAKK